MIVLKKFVLTLAFFSQKFVSFREILHDLSIDYECFLAIELKRLNFDVATLSFRDSFFK